MPIVIDEVVISINVENKGGAGVGPSGGAGASGSRADEKKAIVEECVEQVMDILKLQEEP